MKNLYFSFFTIALLFNFSCDNKSSEFDNLMDEEEVKNSIELDTDLDFLETLSLNEFERENSRNPQSLPDCVSITVIIQQGFKEITLDFGEGCQIGNKNISGIMTLTYDPNIDEQELLITKEYTDLTINQKTINGVKTKLRELSNQNGNPQFTINANININWESGASLNREGTRIRERVSGEQGVWSTYVYHLTGNWTNTFGNGNTYSWEIIDPVVKESICYFFVSGSLSIEKPNVSGVLDYGNGGCDNTAIFISSDGNEFLIALD